MVGSRRSEASSTLIAELLAAHWALENIAFLHNHNDIDIVLEGDSATIIAWLNGESGSLHPRLLQARKLILERGRIRVSLTPRSNNSLADKVASFYRTLGL